MRLNIRQVILLIINLIAMLLLYFLLEETLVDVPMYKWLIPFSLLFITNTASQLVVVNLSQRLSKIETGQGDGSPVP